MPHVVLYIPGLGDRYNVGRVAALKMWRLWGVQVRLLPMEWYSQGTYDEKIRLIRQHASDMIDRGHTVTLVGESAGASLALNAAAVLPGLHKVIVIAGVNSSELPISPYLKKRSPVLAESAARVSESLKTMNARRIHTFRGSWDVVVDARYDTIKGAQQHIVWSIGHLFTILMCLTVLSAYIAYIIRQK